MWRGECDGHREPIKYIEARATSITGARGIVNLISFIVHLQIVFAKYPAEVLYKTPSGLCAVENTAKFFPARLTSNTKGMPVIFFPAVGKSTKYPAEVLYGGVLLSHKFPLAVLM